MVALALGRKPVFFMHLEESKFDIYFSYLTLYFVPILLCIVFHILLCIVLYIVLMPPCQ